MKALAGEISIQQNLFLAWWLESLLAQQEDPGSISAYFNHF